MANDAVKIQGIPLEKASKALILLHGRGGSATDILSLASELCDDTFYAVAPQAPGNSWYPHSFLVDEHSNEPWLSASVDIVKRLIDEISKSISKDKIYLLGFSQGACLALEVAARYATKYGGVIAFTGGLIGQALDTKKYQGNFEGTPVFIGIGDDDPHVPLARAQQSKELMEKMGAEMTFKVYEGLPHTINRDEVAWARELLLKGRHD